ncbi:MAG: type II secretion system F family protein [Candidatus Anammoximicrobium sp.]|nr:type II secretion system F family protein [Candidatus Anammoximicrobium sp.]
MTGLLILICLGVFLFISATIWLVSKQLDARQHRVDQRLDELERAARSSEPGTGLFARVSSVFSGLVEKTTPQLAKPLQPTKLEDVSRLRMRLSHAGFRSDYAETVFLALKVIGLTAGFLLGGGLLLLAGHFDASHLSRVIFYTGGGMFLPDIGLRLLTRRRHEQLFFGLPDAIDLMVVCVEAGLGLDQAMRKVADEMRKSFPAVSHEFELSNLHLQMGITRVQVFRDLGERNGEEDLRSLASVLIHASRFGTGIGQALRNHGDHMRIRRRQMAEERAAKSAVKLIFPLVLFIFPAIFVVLVGPAAINIIRILLPTMMGS